MNMTYILLLQLQSHILLLQGNELLVWNLQRHEPLYALPQLVLRDARVLQWKT